MDWKAIENELLRFQIWVAAISFIATVAWIWISYIVIKNGIRDGIKESGLLEVLRYRPPPRSDLPDIRAD